jgi:ADP-ribose pyrophosphatase
MPEERSSPPSYFEVHSHQRVYEGFHVVDKVDVSFEQFGRGKPRKRETFEVVERGDAAAALLYDPNKREVILVRQFRLPTSIPFRHLTSTRNAFQDVTGSYSGDAGWLLETAAGTIVPAKNGGLPETPEACIRREIREEVGYVITELLKITEFFASPGGSSEMIHLFYAEVGDWQKESTGGGDGAAEDIEVVPIDVEQFFSRLLSNEFRDPKIIIAGQWLRDHLAKRRLEPRNTTRTLEYDLLGDGRNKGAVIGIKTGDIIDVAGVDVWINPENTNMLMDRFFGRSISAAIRWNGASKRQTPRGEVVDRDLIADAIRQKLDGRNYVGLKEIVETGPGELRSKGVQLLLHVAIAEGFYEQGLKTEVSTLKDCVDLSLARIESHNWRERFLRPYRSVLVPMIGTGRGGIPIREVAPALVESALSFLDGTSRRRLNRIYFNPYQTDDYVTLRGLLDELVANGTLKEPRETGALQSPPV